MNNQPETEAEIQEEMEELGIDNNATGAPDLFMSGVVVKVVAAVLIVILVGGFIHFVF